MLGHSGWCFWAMYFSLRLFQEFVWEPLRFWVFVVFACFLQFVAYVCGYLLLFVTIFHYLPDCDEFNISTRLVHKNRLPSSCRIGQEGLHVIHVPHWSSQNWTKAHQNWVECRILDWAYEILWVYLGHVTCGWFLGLMIYHFMDSSSWPSWPTVHIPPWQNGYFFTILVFLGRHASRDTHHVSQSSSYHHQTHKPTGCSIRG